MLYKINFWATVCKTVLPMLSDHCLSCLSVVTLVYCGQTDQDELGMHVGLGHGHTVLDGDPATLPKRAQPPNFQPISVVAKWLHRSRCHLVWR